MKVIGEMTGSEGGLSRDSDNVREPQPEQPAAHAFDNGGFHQHQQGGGVTSTSTKDYVLVEVFETSSASLASEPTCEGGLSRDSDNVCEPQPEQPAAHAFDNGGFNQDQQGGAVVSTSTKDYVLVEVFETWPASLASEPTCEGGLSRDSDNVREPQPEQVAAHAFDNGGFNQDQQGGAVTSTSTKDYVLVEVFETSPASLASEPTCEGGLSRDSDNVREPQAEQAAAHAFDNGGFNQDQQGGAVTSTSTKDYALVEVFETSPASFASEPTCEGIEERDIARELEAALHWAYDNPGLDLSDDAGAVASAPSCDKVTGPSSARLPPQLSHEEPLIDLSGLVPETADEASPLLGAPSSQEEARRWWGQPLWIGLFLWVILNVLLAVVLLVFFLNASGNGAN